MTVFLPARKLEEPQIIEAFGVQEIFIHGTKAIFGEDDVQIVCYIDRQTGEGIERYEVLRVRMTRARYDANLIRSFERYRGAAGDH